MSKSFRNIHGSKNRSSSTTFISLHFNKADEEQLEISYRDEKKNLGDNSKKDEVVAEISAKNKLADEDSSDSEDRSSIIGEENDQSSSTQKSSHSSKESTPSRDSVVREYWSRISKRGSSLDSDLGLPDKTQEQNEGWQIFKEIKGKLAKTLEERKSISKGTNKDDKNVSDGDAGSGKSLLEDKLDPDRTPTDNQPERCSLKLSPAIEASEVENDNALFESYIDNELDRVKCEIISTKPTTPASQFYLQQPAKTVKKKDVSMTLSTLMASRCDSIESTVKNEGAKANEEFPSSTNVSYLTPQTSSPENDNNVFKLSATTRRCYYFVKSYWNSVIFRILIAALALLFVPVPSWLSGFTAGAFLSGYIIYCLFKPGKPREAFVVPDYSQLPPSNIPVSEVEDEPIIYKGWMNELPFDLSYNLDTYHVNCTRSLYIRLDGPYLRVSYPQNNIPKRAMFNETRHERQFVDQQHYDITGSSVELLPVGLARKRLWSKKYPICLKIPNPNKSVPSSVAKDVTDSNMSSKTTARKESPIKKLIPRINENNEIVLYLFSRTDREKDLWYYRFKKASRIKLLKSHSPSSSPNIAAMDASSLENKRTKSVDLASLQLCSNYNDFSVDEAFDETDSFIDLSMTKQQKFEMYMSHLLAPLYSDHSFLFASGTKDKKDESKQAKSSSAFQGNLAWLNVLIGRVFFDFLTEDGWDKLVAEKIQRKLSKIKLPVFLTELSVKDINLGTALPKIHRASEPSIDQRGLWIDIDLSYNGFFQMTLETKLNLLRTKCDSEDVPLSDVLKEADTVDQVLRSPVYNSEEEDSAESSSDEDIPLPEVNEVDDSSAQLSGGSTGKKLLRLVDRFAQSTYFQNAAKNKYIKKAMADISNTPLVLTVEVQWLTGTLALNIPPMPTDRLWYGFRTNPHLSIVARPKLGHHVVTLTHVTDWIERKLVSEFQKILVMPNMDDLIIPIMQSDVDLPNA